MSRKTYNRLHIFMYFQTCVPRVSVTLNSDVPMATRISDEGAWIAQDPKQAKKHKTQTSTATHQKLKMRRHGKRDREARNGRKWSNRAATKKRGKQPP